MELHGERVSSAAASSSSGDRSQVTVSRELLTAGSEGSGGERRPRREGWAGGSGDAVGGLGMRRARDTERGRGRRGGPGMLRGTGDAAGPGMLRGRQGNDCASPDSYREGLAGLGC